ncbi:MAG: UvrD-helicase domain-containing protein, partial [Candidatus Neomarinimicrobiota bacterium]
MNEKGIETNHSDYQKAALAIDESLIVCAAAGTGKTTVLVNRYLEILHNRAAGIDRIAAITFTEKAANEMKERIRTELSKPEFVCTQELRSNLIDQVNLAPISTVHAFCGRMLRDNVFLLGLDPLFTISDETEEKIQRADFTERFLNDSLKSDRSQIPALLEVMELSQIDVLLNAVWNKRAECAGLMEHIRTTSDDALMQEMEILYQKITHQILSEFFDDPENKKAIAQLRALSRPKNSDKLQDCLDLIFKMESEWATDKVSIDSLKQDLKAAFDGRTKGNEKNWSGDLETVRSLRSQLGERWKAIEKNLFDLVEETERAHIRLLKNFVMLANLYIASYRQTMFVSGRIDFGSLETEAVRLLSGKSEQIRRYISRFSHLLVDEFQDINPIQHRIIELICELNPKIVTFFVGDEKQSIYRFRGSEVEIFNRLKNEQTPLRLDLNFRSVPGLMAFFNDFFPFVLGKDRPKETFEANYPVPIDPYFTERADLIPVEFLIVKDDEASGNEEETEDAIVSADAFTSELSEATFVAGKIRELIGKPVVKIKAEPRRDAKFGDMVVLLRSRTHQLEIESMFRKFGIPFYVASGIGFYDRREVQDIVNFLKVMLNYYDEVALIAILRSPMFGVSDFTLTKLNSESGLFEGIRQYFSGTLSKPVHLESEEKALLDRFFSVYSDLQKSLSGMTTAEILTKIISVTDYLTIVGSLADGDQAVANVQKLCGLALEWSDAGNISPIDFIRRIGIYRSIEVREGEANLSSETGDAVTIMTVHASKGLDFPIVFVPFLSSKFNVNKDRLVFHPGEGLALSLKTPFDEGQSFLYKYLKNR